MRRVLSVGLAAIWVFGSACSVLAAIKEVEVTRGGSGLQNVHNKVLNKKRIEAINPCSCHAHDTGESRASV